MTRNSSWVGLAAAVLALWLTGCASSRIDWASRTGHYSYDQAILELGPADKSAKLMDGSVVAEWLTHRGYTSYYTPFATSYSPWFYGPSYGPSFLETSPNYYLRLTFGPDGLLRASKSFFK